MSAPVDVLAVMDVASGTLKGAAAPGSPVGRQGRELAEARAAVAELIEAAKSLSDAVTFRIDDPRCELHCKLVDALVRVHPMTREQQAAETEIRA